MPTFCGVCSCASAFEIGKNQMQGLYCTLHQSSGKVEIQNVPSQNGALTHMKFKLDTICDNL